MKTVYLYTILFGFLLLSSCRNQDAEWMDNSGTGSLSLSALEVQPADAIPLSRAVNPILAVEIEKADGTPVFSFLPDAVELSQKIELSAGDYLLKAYSTNYGTSWADTEIGDPVYYAEQAFHIQAEKVNYLTVAVPMINAGVTFCLPDTFNEWFSSYTFTVQSGTRNASLRQGQILYLNLSPTATVDIQYQLKLVNIDGEEFTLSDTFSDLQPGKLYEITYSTETRLLSIR